MLLVLRMLLMLRRVLLLLILVGRRGRVAVLALAGCRWQWLPVSAKKLSPGRNTTRDG
jgi:hypothetical protein